MVAKMKKANVLVLFCFILIQFAAAQDSIPRVKRLQKTFLQNDDHWTIEVPIWIPGFRGQFTYGDVSLEGEDGNTPENPIEPGWNPGDYLSRIFGKDGNLNFFFMNRISYRNQKFYAQFDAFSGGVGESIYFRYNQEEVVQAKFSTYLFRFFAGYLLFDKQSVSEKFNYRLYGYGGIRIHSVNVISDLNFVQQPIQVTPVWIEPLLGIRNELALKRWLFVLQGDVGGFKIDGRISYMINAHGYYRISNLLSIKLGWCDWDMNYKDKHAQRDLKLRMHLSGPSTALTFNF
jgi:hypothetical protein